MKNAGAILAKFLLFHAFLAMPSDAGAPAAQTAAPKPAPAGPVAPQKFALLVGVNNYLYARKLLGPVQDVALMKDVLTAKFSFPAENILTLTNQRATRDGIIAGFKSHLIDNAQKNRNAIVVFHFSGHGSQVADQNGDEADGLDETLMPVDSRDKENQNFDILDDELYELFRELSQHTANITFILDSCHSGSATRAGTPLIAREMPTDARPQPRRAPLSNPGRANKQPDSQTIDILPPGANYVAISGCLAFQQAFERDLRKTGGKPNGTMTYHLAQALRRATPQMTYRQIMEEVAIAVTNENPNQTPQVEGDVGRAVFGGAATREDPFIRIARVEGRMVTLQAGQAQGIREGAVIAIYSPEAQRLAGEEKKLTEAVVKKVDALSAIAEMPESPKIKQATDRAKATLLTPHTGLAPLRVALSLGSVARGAGSATSIEAAVAERLEDNAMIEVIGATTNRQDAWDVALTRGRFGEAFPDKRFIAPAAVGSDEALPTDEAEVYYLDAGDGQPLFGLFVRPDDPSADEKLAEALAKLAKQRNLRALANPHSPLNDGVKVTVLRVEGEITDEGRFLPKDEQPVAAPTDQANYVFPAGVYFKLKIENQTGRDIFVTVINIATDGGIKIMYPRRGAREPLLKESRFTPIYRTSGPPGLDTFKIIATTSYTDFSFLEEGGARRSAQSPLEGLITQSKTGTRNGGSQDLKLDQWGTRQIHFVITNRKP